MTEFLSDFKLVFFALGTLGFFASVYLSVKHPELVKPAQTAPEDLRVKPAATAPEAVDGTVDWRKLDDISTWLMWGGWAAFGVITLMQSIEKNLGFMQ